MAKRTFKENGVSVEVFIKKKKSHTNDTSFTGLNKFGHLLLSKVIKFLFIISKVLQILIGER